MEKDLVALTRRAGSECGRMLLVLAVEAARRPITASCLVSLLPHAVRDEAALQALAVEHSDGAVVSVVEQLGENRDVDALAEQYADAVGLGETPAESGSQSWTPGATRHVDVYLPVPDSPRVLLLSFSTPLVPLFEPLTELFLMMSGTVQWDRGDGTWS